MISLAQFEKKSLDLGIFIRGSVLGYDALYEIIKKYDCDFSYLLSLPAKRNTLVPNLRTSLI